MTETLGLIFAEEESNIGKMTNKPCTVVFKSEELTIECKGTENCLAKQIQYDREKKSNFIEIFGRRIYISGADVEQSGVCQERLEH